MDIFESDYAAALDHLQQDHRVGSPSTHPSKGHRLCRVDGLALDDATIIRMAFGDGDFSARILKERGQK